MGNDWYIAEIVLEIVVEQEAMNVVHTNLVLVQAESAERAYEKAMQCGKDGESTYANPQGKSVTLRFRGLRNLLKVYDPLEDGAELFYEERVGVGETELLALIREKVDMTAFLPLQGVKPNGSPDYSCGEIMREALEMVKAKREKRLETEGLAPD